MNWVNQEPVHMNGDAVNTIGLKPNFPAAFFRET